LIQVSEVIVKNGGEAVPLASVGIPVKTGHGEERVVDLRLGSRVTEILDIIAAEHGWRIEELILVREGEEEVLTSAILIEAAYPHKRRHHVHHAGDVEVMVYYQARHEARRFRRNATVEDVLTWAITAFKVDATMASEFELTRHDQKEELPGSEHIGHLAGPHRELALDLVRGNIANGSGA
jgi:hypothetical protein